MFSDVANFTTIAESLKEARRLRGFLFEVMGLRFRAVFECRRCADRIMERPSPLWCRYRLSLLALG